MKQISVIMPALNEEAAILDAVKSTLDAFNKLGLDGEIVVVNDGSTDKTPDIVKDLQKKFPDKINLYEHRTPLGVGKSFMDGVMIARGEGVVLIPGDNENNAVETLLYTPLLRYVDIINPYVVNKEVRGVSRKLISSLFTFIVNVTFGASFKYTNGTIIYRSSIFKGLEVKSSGFFFQAEALVKLARLGYLISEVPCFLSVRKGGVSKALTLKSLKKVMGGYFSLIREIYFSNKYKFDKNKLSPDSKRRERMI